MKKQIAKWLSITVLLVMTLLLVLNYYLQLSSSESNFEINALATVDQMEAIIAQNDAALESLTAGVKEDYIIRAQMAAYVLENVEISTEEEYAALAELLDVDEIHAFSAEGVIYAGSVSKYIGYSFDSGDQMAFFKPMLSDTTLSLCQDVTANTAEGKMMIYAAVWRSDGEGIVQVGLEPERLIEAQSQNELSYIFSAMPVSNGMNLYAVEASSGIVLGSTDETIVGQFDSIIRDIIDETTKDETSFYAEINGVECIVIFRQVGDVYIGVSQEKSVLAEEILGSTLNSAVHICVASFVLLAMIMLIIDYVVLKNMNRLVQRMTQIANGNLEAKVNVNASPEFAELSDHINTMVSSLMSMTVKLSQVLEKVDVRMAIYEYKEDMERVLATSNIGSVLELFPSQTALILANKEAFQQKMLSVQKYRIPDEENVYDLEGKGDHFLKIEAISDEKGSYGVIVDVTEEVLEMRKISYERDYDVLTNVYNRRAFLNRLQTIVKKDDPNKHVAVIVLDMDNLKKINDSYGHSAGDDAIRECVRAMKEVETPNKIVARMGGDEFMIVLHGAQSEDALLAHIQALERASKQLAITVEQESVAIEMSAGYVFSVETDADYSALEKQADEALYRAKRSGKARFVEY